jgi:hypothetical protein
MLWVMPRFRNAICGILVLFTGLFNTSISAQDLERGRFEVRAFGGTNAVGWNREPSWGAGGAFGLSKFVAITAGYTHDNLQSLSLLLCTSPFFLLPGQTIDPTSCVRNDVNSALHEFMGGVRVSAVNRSRFTPYAGFSLGAVKRTSHSSSAGFGEGADLTEFGFAPGAGLDVKVTRHFGVCADAAYVKANRFTGFYRVTGGVFFRF